MTLPATSVLAQSATAPLHSTTFQLAQTKVTIQSPYLPATQFSFPQPNIAEANDYHPLQEFVVQFTPYGLTPNGDLYPLAKVGSETTYRTILQKLFSVGLVTTKDGPTAKLFGKNIVADVAILPLHFDGATSVLSIVWTVEAQGGIWQVRVTVARTVSELAQESVMLASLGHLTMQGHSVGLPAQTSKPTTNIIRPNFVTAACGSGGNTFPCPNWWQTNNGTTPSCDSAYNTGSYAVASYRGVEACGTSTNVPVTAEGIGMLEWQCAELAHRYVAVAYGIQIRGGNLANGNGIARDYRNTPTNHNSTLIRVINGSTDVANDTSSSDLFSTVSHIVPVPGDVLSEGITRTDGGHTVLVSASNIVGGTGSFTVIEQNSASVETYNITNYQIDPNKQVIDWLHDPANTGGNINQTISTELVYAIGSNGHLYEYWPDGALVNWSDRDLNTTTSMTSNLVGQPSASWLKQSGQIVHDIYATGIDGHIHEFYYQNSAWYKNDISSANGSFTPTFTLSPYGYSYTDGSGNPHHGVYAVATDGSLYAYQWSSPTGWTIQRTTPPSGLVFTGTPTAYSYNKNGDQLVYAITNDGKLREYGNNAGNTSPLTPINTFSPPSGTTYTGQPSAYSYVNNGNTLHFVYAKGSNSQVYNLYYSPATNWQGPYPMLPAAMLSAGGMALGSPNGHPSFQDATPLQFIYTTTNSGGGLQEMYDGSNTPSSWTNIGLGPGVSSITGSPVAYTYLSSSGTTTHNVWFTQTDGLIHLEYYTNGWAFTSLPAVSGVSFSGATPSAYFVPVGA